LIESRFMSPTEFANDLFKGMPKQEVEAVLAAASPRKFHASEVIVDAGKLGTRLFLIKTGRVKYYRLTSDGREILLGMLGPGNIFGLGTLLPEPTEYLGTAQALTSGDAFVWTHASLRKLHAKYPKLAENALRIVLGYLAASAKRHIRLLSKTAEQRLGNTLIRLANQFGRVVPRGVRVDVKNEYLASLADVNFFTASRLLKSWERSGAVRKGRGTVTILHPERLCSQCDRPSSSRHVHWSRPQVAEVQRQPSF
jgi:CRP-like cAMP-binding protein